MRTISRAASLLFVFLVATGCELPIMSLRPVATPDILVFENLLLGSWVDRREEKEWLFEEELSEEGYIITITDNGGEKYIFEASLVKLGENYFLETFPAEDTRRLKNWIESGFYPVYQIRKIHWQGNTIKLLGLDYEWLEKQQKNLAVEIGSESFLFLSPTKTMQEFLKEYGGSEKAFPGLEKTELHRKIE